MTTYDRVVLGAGLAGLLAARRATQRGESVLLLERTAQHGGAIAPLTIAGVKVDAGAEAYSTVSPEVFTLLQQLGLDAAEVYPRDLGARILLTPKRAARIPHGILGIPATLDDPELAQFVSPTALADARYRDAQPIPRTHNMSVADLVRSRLGPDFLSRIVNPVVSGVHGSSAHTIPAASALAPVLCILERCGSLCAAVSEIRGSLPRPGSAVASLRGGLHQLPDALLYEFLSAGGQARFEQHDLRLLRERERWRVQSGRFHYLTRALSIAIGASSDAFARQLLPTALRWSRHSRPNAASLVFVAVESEQLRGYPLGTGALVPGGVQVSAKATTHVNAKWEWIDAQLAPNTHILRLSYGRSGPVSRQRVVQTAHTDLGALYGTSDHRIQECISVSWPETLSASPLVARNPGVAQCDTTHSRELEHFQNCTAAYDVEVCGPVITGNGIRSVVADHLRKSPADASREYGVHSVY